MTMTQVSCFRGLPVLLGLAFVVFSSHLVAQENNRLTRSADWLLPMTSVEAAPEIPDSKEVLGYHWGEEVSGYSQVESYLKVLSRSAPERTRLVKYGETYEGRPLYYLVISSAANMRQLDALQSVNLTLADPRNLDAEEAAQLSSDQPAMVWLAYSVHGNEISCTDAALLTAYHLLADQSDATTELLERLVVIIDPLQNPDGRERFVTAFREARGLFSQSDPAANEHTERWPGGRQNHYWFDMNRDWFRQSQQESHAKVQAFLEWMPQIYVDAHEMGRNSTYYFAPPADPISPFLLPTQKEWLFRIGRHQAGRFDEYGFSYTTREMFDAFYPGYGSEWPTMQGSIGILWEQASARGLVVDRDDDSRLYYHDGVRHHYVSGIATLEIAAANREQLLTDFYEARLNAVDSGRNGEVRHFFLLPDANRDRAEKLASVLANNGIEIYQTQDWVHVVGVDSRTGEEDKHLIPAGSLHIPVEQPTGRLIRSLLDRGVDMDDSFVQRQLARNEHRLPDEIYDVTAWSLPLAFDVPCIAAGPVNRLQSEPWKGPFSEGKLEQFPAKVAYLIRPTDRAMQAVAAWIQDDVRVHVTNRSLSFEDNEFPRGTIIVKVNENDESLHDRMKASAADFGIDITGTDTGFVTSGANLGGPYVSWIRPPRVLIVCKSPVSYSVGHTWYLFDQVLRYPSTRVAAEHLRRVDLENYNVIVLGDGGYSGDTSFGEGTSNRLKEWVRKGGTLITSKGATRWAANEEIDLIANRVVRKPIEVEGGEGDQSSADGEQTEAPSSAPGAFLRASTFGEHWVTYGYPEELDIFYTGNLILTPTPANEGRTLVKFAKQEELLSSGFCWPSTLELQAESPYAVYRSLGRGHIVAFTDDPNYRAMYPALQRFFINAVMFGPGF